MKSLKNMLKKTKTPKYFNMLNRLVDPMTGTKSYWSTWKMFLNNKKNPFIARLSHQNKYVTDIKEKAEIFNYFFAEQCPLIKNSSRLPLKVFKKNRKDYLISIV